MLQASLLNLVQDVEVNREMPLRLMLYGAAYEEMPVIRRGASEERLKLFAGGQNSGAQIGAEGDPARQRQKLHGGAHAHFDDIHIAFPLQHFPLRLLQAEAVGFGCLDDYARFEQKYPFIAAFLMMLDELGRQSEEMLQVIAHHPNKDEGIVVASGLGLHAAEFISNGGVHPPQQRVKRVGEHAKPYH